MTALRFGRYWVPALAYAALITFFSGQQGGGTPRWEVLRLIFQHDKLMHLAEYSVLGFLLLRALLGGDVARPMAAVVAVGLGVAFGVLDELHQSFVPGREGNDVGDLVADACGAALGAGTYFLWRRTHAPSEVTTDGT